MANLIHTLREASRERLCARGTVAAALLDPDGEVAYVDVTRPLDTDPPCLAHCHPGERCRHSVHAEMWCVRAMYMLRESPVGFSIASTDAPCYRCAQLIVMSGIRTVRYLRPYREEAGLVTLVNAGVTVEQLDAGW